MNFESIKISDDEDNLFFLQSDEIVNGMRGLDENIKDPTIVQKVLRSLPGKFNHKVSSIEEMSKL